MKYLSLCGMLGYGYAPASLERALAQNLDFIGVDAGSTDPGPYYLGSGANFVKALQVKRDLGLVLATAIRRKIPLIIGSAGGAGARPHVESVLAILRELARENRLTFRAAVIYSDLDKTFLRQAAAGHLFPCGGSPEFDPADIDALCHPVAQFGTEPVIAALGTGADVIVAGRCCDTAIFAALPILRGYDPGLALHAAKIAECGALCARPAGANDSLLIELKKDCFLVEPADPQRKCTPDSVIAHSLYEQPDPNCFYEPEGKIDLTDAVFQPIDERTVEVRGTKLIPSPRPTTKLEGARRCGFRAVTIAGIRDPAAIASLDELEAGVRADVAASAAFLRPGEYTLRFLHYGRDAVTGANEAPVAAPREIGLLIEGIAPTQQQADALIALARSKALHQAFPNRKATAGNLAFPFSPSDFQGGAVYEFALYHLTDLPLAFPVELMEIGCDETL